MAGFYPDVPAARMAYDRDGTTGFYATSSGSVISTMTPLELAKLDSEAAGDALAVAQDADAYFVGLIFPQLRDVSGVTIVGTTAQPGNLAVSSDTTDGINGSWTIVVPGFYPIGDTGAYLRTGIITIAPTATNVRAIRFAPGAGVDVLHVYGVISSGQQIDRLRFWHATLDQPLEQTPAYLDYGEVERGSSEDRSFRVKNDSLTLTAQSVTVSFDVRTEADPVLEDQFSLSLSGSSTTGTSITVGDIAPQSITPLVTLSRSTSADAQLGLWSPRVLAVAGSWS